MNTGNEALAEPAPADQATPKVISQQDANARSAKLPAALPASLLESEAKRRDAKTDRMVNRLREGDAVS